MCFPLSEVKLFRGYSKGRKLNEVRAVAFYLARFYSGCTLVEIGEYFGGLRPPAVSLAHKRIGSKVARNRRFCENILSVAAEL